MTEESLRISLNGQSGTSLAELQLKLAEYIVAREGYLRKTDVRGILDETKVGAWRRQALVNKLRIIFSAG